VARELLSRVKVYKFVQVRWVPQGIFIQHVEPEVLLAAVAKCLAERNYMVSAFLLEMT
jgi:hypothetical protein